MAVRIDKTGYQVSSAGIDFTTGFHIKPMVIRKQAFYHSVSYEQGCFSENAACFNVNEICRMDKQSFPGE